MVAKASTYHSFEASACFCVGIDAKGIKKVKLLNADYFNSFLCNTFSLSNVQEKKIS